MTRHHDPTGLITTATLFDVLSWAEAVGEDRDAIRELRRVPARLGLVDEDLPLVPADLGFFEASVAPTAYALVSQARDQLGARQRANSRLRALLGRFHAARAGLPRKTGGDAGWGQLVDYVKKHEGFVDRGARFTKGRSRSLAMLRARATSAPDALDQEAIDRMAAGCSADKRKSLRKALRFLNDLIAAAECHPEIAALLPVAPLPMPTPVARGRRILWKTLPAPFRASAEAALARVLAGPEDWAAEAYARIEAGADPEHVYAELNAEVPQRRRPPRNTRAALASYRGAVTWLLRAAEGQGQRRQDLTRIEDLLRFSVIVAAVEAEAGRQGNRPGCGTSAKTQTLNARLTALRTICKRGLHRGDLVATLAIIEKKHAAAIVKPAEAEMPERIGAFCQELKDHPDIAARLVRGPWQLADLAEARLAAATNRGAALSALRIYIAAALLALQMSRPVRPENLIRLRLRATEHARGNMKWLPEGNRLRVQFAKGEVKNHRLVGVPVSGRDAEILRRWQSGLRPRYLKLRGIGDSAYLFPGEARPRMLPEHLDLPAGCLSVSSFAEIWNDGMAHLGLRLTPHMCRHAVATLTLAVHPGSFGLAAAILADAEDTVRKHYGQDSGEAAAQSIRAHLLGTYPDLFRQLTRGKA